jgi:ABC-2 type transport system ATP-binding protein
MVEGLRRPDSGEALLLGERSWPRNTRLLKRVGVQLQASAFFERLTAKEQLETFGALYGTSSQRITEMLEMVGLTDKAGTQAEKLSGGQAQRLSIACALIHDPEIVFLDEPSAALDPQARRNLWDVLRGINERGKTVVLTTHYMDEAESLCDRVAIMDNGRILQLGPPAELVRTLDVPVRISVEAGSLSVELARSIEGVEEVTGDKVSTVIATRRPAPVLAALAEADALEGLQVRGATLEDVFLDLTGREYRA